MFLCRIKIRSGSRSRVNPPLRCCDARNHRCGTVRPWRKKHRRLQWEARLTHCVAPRHSSASALYFAFTFVQMTGYECATRPNIGNETPPHLQNGDRYRGAGRKWCQFWVTGKSTMQPEWNALYVQHNHEKAASRFLAAHGVDHYLPLYSEQSEWSTTAESWSSVLSFLVTCSFVSRWNSGNLF